MSFVPVAIVLKQQPMQQRMPEPVSPVPTYPSSSTTTTPHASPCSPCSVESTNTSPRSRSSTYTYRTTYSTPDWSSLHIDDSTLGSHDGGGGGDEVSTHPLPSSRVRSYSASAAMTPPTRTRTATTSSVSLKPPLSRSIYSKSGAAAVAAEYQMQSITALQDPQHSERGGGGGGNDEDDSEQEMQKSKSEIDRYRERGANMRALMLLDENFAGNHVRTCSNGANYEKHVVKSTRLTTRQAAALRYEERQKIKHQLRIKLEIERLNNPTRPPPTLIPPKPREQMAESTRKIKKELSNEDVRDPETVAGMKCQLDWDREKDAQAKALRLIRNQQGYGVV